MMSGKANLTLSDEELQLVTRSQWILTKRVIMDKAVSLFGSISEQLQELIKTTAGLPEEIIHSVPKISKGENYKGLPYVVLDHPRYFGKTDVLAMRTIFWWGNYFSLTLHLSGIYRQKYEAVLLGYLLQCNDDALHIFTGTDPWEHHFEDENYLPVTGMEQVHLRSVIGTGKCIKLAYRYPLEEWEKIPSLVQERAVAWLQLLRS